MAGARPRLLILDRLHRVLDDGDGGLELEVAGAASPLAAIEHTLATRFGLSVPAPIGSRPAVPRAPRDFVFVLEGDPAPAPPGLRWRPLAEAATVGARADWLWDLYVDRVLGGCAPPRRDVDVFMFGAGAAMAGRLAHLVVAGCKRATAMWLDAARIDGSTVPAHGSSTGAADGASASVSGTGSSSSLDSVIASRPTIEDSLTSMASSASAAGPSSRSSASAVASPIISSSFATPISMTSPAPSSSTVMVSSPGYSIGGGAESFAADASGGASGSSVSAARASNSRLQTPQRTTPAAIRSVPAVTRNTEPHCGHCVYKCCYPDRVPVNAVHPARRAHVRISNHGR